MNCSLISAQGAVNRADLAGCGAGDTEKVEPLAGVRDSQPDPEDAIHVFGDNDIKQSARLPAGLKAGAVNGG
jgi:hypothetical protein